MPQPSHNTGVSTVMPEQVQLTKRSSSAGAPNNELGALDEAAAYYQSQRLNPSSNASSTSSSSSLTSHATSKAPSPAPSTESADDGEPPLTRWEILCLCLPAAAVQIGWTVGESLLIPYLLSLGVSNTVANFAWLINPLFGLFLQPMLGHASDNCQSSFGRRRPFLFVFHLGSVCGLLTVVFAANILEAIGLPAKTSDGASTYLIALVFLGFATADMCHDLLLMPARALLNDQLPDEQTDEGNSYFALISSLGSIIGLSMVIAPLDELPLLRKLELPIRATFFCAAVLVMLSNIISFIIARNIDTPLSELQQIKHDNEVEAAAQAAGRSNSASVAASPPPSEPHKSSGGEEFLTLSTILFVFRIVPRPLVVIWLCQFFFWYAVLHVNIWTSSYVAVDIYGATVGDEFDAGVRAATVGLLVQAVVSFFASSIMTRANATFGITNYYHFSALLYGSAAVAMFFFRSYPVFLCLMAVTGMALPAIYSSPFVLIEVHAADVEDDDEDESEEEHSDDPEKLEEEERRKEHKQLDVHLDTTRAHPPDGALHHSVSSVDTDHMQAQATPSKRPVKHVSISLPTSRSPSPRTSPSASTRATGGSPLEATAGDDSDEDSSEQQNYDMEFLDEWRGVLTGVYNVTMTLAQIIVGLTSGVMIDWYGHIGIVFVWSGALCVAVHGGVALFGLSKPIEEEVEEEEVEEESPVATESTPLVPARPRLVLAPPRLLRPQTMAPAMPPLLEFRQLSTRALPGRLGSYVHAPHVRQPSRRHIRNLTHHQAPTVEHDGLAPPSLHRSLSAPALVLLSRPNRVVRGVPVFQSHAGVGRPASNDRMQLERQRERTRLFNQASPAVRRRHERLNGKHSHGGRPHHHVAYGAEQKSRDADRHERDMWFSGKQAHQQAALRHDRALQEGEAALRQGGGDELYDDADECCVPMSGPATAQAALLASGGEQGPREPVFNFDVASARSIAEQQAAGIREAHEPARTADATSYPFPLRSSLSLPDMYEERRPRPAVQDRIVEEEEDESDG